MQTSKKHIKKAGGEETVPELMDTRLAGCV